MEINFEIVNLEFGPSYWLILKTKQETTLILLQETYELKDRCGYQLTVWNQVKLWKVVHGKV